MSFTDGTDTFQLFNRAGTPEANIAADIGSISVDTANGALYVKTTDTVNTGWSQLASGTTAWLNGGNSFSTASPDVFGSNNAHDIQFRANATTAATIYENSGAPYFEFNRGIKVLNTLNSDFQGNILDTTGTLSLADDVDVTGVLGLQDGTAAAPAFTFTTVTSDTDTGIYHPGSNRLGFSTAGTQRVEIDASGNVGIGDSSPLATLTVGAGDLFQVAGATGNVTTSGDVAVNGGDVTSTGTLNVTSASTNALTLDSGTTGAINIGTGANAKTLTLGNTTGATALNLNVGTGRLNVSNASGLTQAIMRITNSIDSIDHFITNATPEGAITGSIGDMATDGTNGLLYIKVSGSATTTGWQSVNTANGACTASGSFACNAGNTLGASLTLGTNDSNVFNLETNNTIRFAISGTAATLTGSGATTLAGGSTLDITSAAASALSITSGTTGALSLDSGTTGAINIGTGANAKTLTLGNTTGATALNINVGTGKLNVANASGSTQSIMSLTNTVDTIDQFITNATPESAITGSIGDLAVDATGGALYIKNTGTATNTGWKKVVAGGVAVSDLIAATATNTIDNLNYAQTWNWSTLSSQKGMRWTANSLDQGGMLSLESSGPLSNGYMFRVDSSNTAAASSIFQVQSASTTSATSGIVHFSFAAHTGDGFVIDDSTTTGTSAMTINANSATSAKALVLSNTNAGRTGRVFQITATGSNSDSIAIQDSTNACTGNPGAGAFTWTCPSDERLKHDIADSAPVLDNLMNLRIRQFKMNSDNSEEKYGVIAQQMQQTGLSWLVGTDSETGMLKVSEMNPYVLVKAIQETNLKLDQVDIQDLLSGVAFADVVRDESPKDAYNYLTSLINDGKSVVKNFVSVRVTAIRGYFDKVFAKEVHTEKLCVGSTCVTEAELQQLLQNQAVNAGNTSQNSTPQQAPVATPDPTPEVASEVTGTPESQPEVSQPAPDSAPEANPEQASQNTTEPSM
jgi:hypothetical protein